MRGHFQNGHPEYEWAGIGEYFTVSSNPIGSYSLAGAPRYRHAMSHGERIRGQRVKLDSVWMESEPIEQLQMEMETLRLLYKRWPQCDAIYKMAVVDHPPLAVRFHGFYPTPLTLLSVKLAARPNSHNDPSESSS